MAFKASASLPALLLFSTLFLAFVSLADSDIDQCIQQCPSHDLRCRMGCLQQKEHRGGGMQPLVPREAYQHYCQQRCEMKEPRQQMLQECQRRCMEEFEQQQSQGGGEINDDEGEQWEEMREDMCEKSCLLKLGLGGDQQQQEQCERSCHKKLTLQYKKCRQSCQKQTNGKSKQKQKQCQTLCREQIEQEQQEKLERQEQEQQEQQEQEQQGQQGQQEQGQQGQQAEEQSQSHSQSQRNNPYTDV